MRPRKDTSRLAFVPSLGTPSGFRTREGADDEIVVRELIQNALDAGADRVSFRTMHVPVEQVPAIDDYRSAVGRVLPDLTCTPPARHALEHIGDALGGKHITVLLCVDNGTGFGESEYVRLISEAMSFKTNENAAGKLGSVGVGHLTAVDASALFYVLYASRTGGGLLYGGQTLLATQQTRIGGKVEQYVPQGCLTDETNLAGFRGYAAKPAAIDAMPAWMQPPEPRGSVVAILGYGSLNESDGRDNGTLDEDLAGDRHMDRIFDAAAKHFTVALRNGKMSLEYASEVRSAQHLDSDGIKERLRGMRSQLRARKGHAALGSGASAWETWETLTAGTFESLGPHGSLWVRLTPGKAPSVVVFRNGMRITSNAPILGSQNFSGVNSFHAVIDADGQFAEFLKACETDSHLSISLVNAPKKDSEQARKELQKIRELIKEHVGTVDTETWTPELLKVFADSPDEIHPAPAPPRNDRSSDEAEQLTIEDEWDPDPPDPVPSPVPSPPDPPEPGPRPRPKPQWKPGNRKDIAVSFIPITSTRAAVTWKLGNSNGRKPSNVGVAVVVENGSRPVDATYSSAPQNALQVRMAGATEEQWGAEVKVPAGGGAVELEVRNPPVDWQAVRAIVSKRS